MKMVICAVFGCNNDNYKKLDRNKDNCDSNSVKYHRFPQVEDLAKIWVKKSKRANRLDIKTASICSKHFKPEDYNSFGMNHMEEYFLKRILLKK